MDFETYMSVSRMDQILSDAFSGLKNSAFRNASTYINSNDNLNTYNPLLILLGQYPNDNLQEWLETMEGHIATGTPSDKKKAKIVKKLLLHVLQGRGQRVAAAKNAAAKVPKAQYSSWHENQGYEYAGNAAGMNENYREPTEWGSQWGSTPGRFNATPERVFENEGYANEGAANAGYGANAGPANAGYAKPSRRGKGKSKKGKGKGKGARSRSSSLSSLNSAEVNSEDIYGNFLQAIGSDQMRELIKDNLREYKKKLKAIPIHYLDDLILKAQAVDEDNANYQEVYNLLGMMLDERDRRRRKGIKKGGTIKLAKVMKRVIRSIKNVVRRTKRSKKVRSTRKKYNKV